MRLARLKRIAVVLFALVLCAGAEDVPARKPLLWSDPGDIRSKNLFWGAGGEQGQPKLPVTFDKEDLHGTSPKFEIRDAAGKKWGAKTGLEPRPETAISRSHLRGGRYRPALREVPLITVEDFRLDDASEQVTVLTASRVD